MSGFIVPNFARIEIRLAGKAGLKAAAEQLRLLADKLDEVRTSAHDDPMADYLACGVIRPISKKLRGDD